MINNELLANLRKKKKWSYKYVANKLECPIEIVKLWESGELSPTPKEIEDIAKLYDLDVSSFYLEEERHYKKINTFFILGLLILGIIIGGFTHELIYMILLPILNIMTYIFIYYLRREDSTTTDVPKSLFGYNILQHEKKIYFYESNIIALIYTYFSLFFRILHFDLLVPYINIFSSKNVNTLVIIGVAYLLLMFLSFIIELVFGFIMKNHYEE